MDCQSKIDKNTKKTMNNKQNYPFCHFSLIVWLF